MTYFGDFALESTIHFKFTTVNSSGVPTQLAGTPSVDIYEDNSTTQITAAETLTVDFDAITGLNHLQVNCTAANGFEAGKQYQAVIAAGTVGGSSVVGYVVGQFSIEKTSALRPTTAGRTLDVNANLAAEANVTEWSGTAVATPTVAGVPEVDVTHWIGTAAATPTVAGVPEVDITHIGGDNQSQIDLKDFADAGYDPATNKVQGVVLTDTLTTYTGNTPQTGNVYPLVDAEIAQLLIDTAQIIDDIEVAGVLVASVGTGAIVPGSFAAGAIDSAALAASAVTEIRAVASGVADSGTTTTMVDAARTEADADYWKGALIVFTSGAIAGQSRVITGFTPGTDTITFAPALTQAVGTETYEIFPNGVPSEITDIKAKTDNLPADPADASDINTSFTTVNTKLDTIDDFLDTEIAAILAAVDTEVAAIKAVTDLIPNAGALTTIQADLDNIQTRLPASVEGGGIKKNTALSNFEFLMIDATDHVSPKTGLTITGTRSIDGGAFGAVTGTFAEISSGVYQFDAAAGDTNGDIITWKFSGTGADDTLVTFKTVV